MPKLHVLSMSVVIVMAFIVPYGIKASTTPLELLACEKRTDENSDTPETVCGAQMNCYCGEGSFVNCSLVMSGSNIDCDTQCSSCSPSSGEYAPFENRCTSCRNATVCKANEEVDKEVTGRSDRTCRCRDWPIPRDVCELHNCTDLSCPPCPEPSSCPTPTAVEVTEQSRCPRLGPDTFGINLARRICCNEGEDGQNGNSHQPAPLPQEEASDVQD
ncbi:uncharacterized protein LOC110986567 isoform X2 [Acanthaster planci]|uniref:Uncharacterized protein LOC110986567 isoform X2 n=1 Tax=Acanthaster planci TaxID=133434 RepID=A0A8B7ZF15_ACAPL|nr:uncharacterized protein LOC110986567 isoform X2 [Acanthaster planci]